MPVSMDMQTVLVQWSFFNGHCSMVVIPWPLFNGCCSTVVVHAHPEAVPDDYNHAGHAFLKAHISKLMATLEDVADIGKVQGQELQGLEAAPKQAVKKATAKVEETEQAEAVAEDDADEDEDLQAMQARIAALRAA